MKALLLLWLLTCNLVAQEQIQQPYGVLLGVRAATIPYHSSHDAGQMVSLVPWMWYEGERFYMRATDYGLHLYKNDHLELNVLASLRYVDIPRSANEYFSSDVIDTGLNLRLSLNALDLDLSWLQDANGRDHAKMQLERTFANPDVQLKTALGLQYYSREYNRFYYGAGEDLNADVGASVAIEGSVDISKHLQLYSKVSTHYLGNEAAASAAVATPWHVEAVAGVRVGNMHHKQNVSTGENYLQTGFGIATLGSFSELLTLSAPSDPHANRLYSLFYGHLLEKHFLSENLRLYLHSGLAYHEASRVQEEALEAVSAFKFYYAITSTLAFGVATGISYITEPTYVERWANHKDGYDETSHLMHHLELSLEYRFLKNLSAGYEIFHRSGIFESVQSYGQIKGGSNYHHLFVKLYM